ncbi:hypothetical protein M3Y94_00928200 [Aphelenchoides besseyi]|nr:hypothetical protein M3Y94_00928200 [Aphelenchoides besseyi]KAI6225021.1 hypothetical protein M3Y95_00814300 [Aphelenchoides besseyi]
MTATGETQKRNLLLKPISSVVTSLRPLNADLHDSIAELNDLWRQMRAVQRTNFEERDTILAMVQLNLTERIGKFQESLSSLRSHISTLQSQLNFAHVQSVSRSFDADLRIVRDHLVKVNQKYEEQLQRLLDSSDELAIEEQSLFDASYRLVAALRRLRSDLML